MGRKCRAKPIKVRSAHLYGAHHHGTLRCSSQLHKGDRSFSIMSPKGLGWKELPSFQGASRLSAGSRPNVWRVQELSQGRVGWGAGIPAAVLGVLPHCQHPIPYISSMLGLSICLHNLPEPRAICALCELGWQGVCVCVCARTCARVCVYRDGLLAKGHRAQLQRLLRFPQFPAYNPPTPVLQGGPDKQQPWKEAESDCWSQGSSCSGIYAP